MKRLVTTAGLLCLSFTTWRTSACFAQADAADIYAVAALNEQTAVAFDAWGRLLRTTDGRYFSAEAVADVPIYGLSFALANYGNAVGEGGTILRSNDGGITWEAQLSGTDSVLLGVFVLDDSIATAVGFDAGATWTTQTAGVNAWLHGIWFVDASTGWVVGEDPDRQGIVLHTTDGGDSWTAQSIGAEVPL